MKTDNDTTIQAVKDAVADFLKARGWGESEPRGLAISIVLEASELLEHFQWREHDESQRQEIANELADVIICCTQLATKLDIDLATACREKLARQAKKYPTEIFNPSSKGTTGKIYKEIKKAYRAKGESA